MLIAIDFDGTIVEHAFPAIGNPLPNAFEVMKTLQDAGHELILNTCREDHPTDTNQKYLTEAVEYCRENGIEFISINENRPEDDFREFTLRRKVYADIYIDDRMVGGLPSWDVIAVMILSQEEE